MGVAKTAVAVNPKQASFNARKVVTQEFRVAFPNLFAPKAFEGQEPKYSLVMLLDKKSDMSKLKAAVKTAIEEKWPDAAKRPKNLRLPFRDGDEKSDLQGYPGTIYITASNKDQPGLVNQKREAILSPKDFYPGCYARAEVVAFAYDTAGNRGVSFSLQNVQKTRDGQSFSGRKRAEDVFDEVEDTSDDPASYSGDDSDDELGI